MDRQSRHTVEGQVRGLHKLLLMLHRDNFCQQSQLLQQLAHHPLELLFQQLAVHQVQGQA
jgi:hypothetical protein